jgi:hypothetical protein
MTYDRNKYQRQRDARKLKNLCTYSLCTNPPVGYNHLCKEHADAGMVRVRRFHFHYTAADEARFQKAIICDWCGLPLCETPTQDHDHRCCPQKGFSCGRCLRGLVHRVCNLHAITWFEWFEEQTGEVLPMLRIYRAKFPRTI